MKTNRNDYFNKIFVGVLILHIIFIYVMPGLKQIVIEKQKLVRIKFGDNIDVINIDSKTNFEKKEATKGLKPKEVKVVEIKKEIKIVEKKIEIPKRLEVTQSFDDLDILTSLESPREVREDKRPKIIEMRKEKDRNKIMEFQGRQLKEVDENIESFIKKILFQLKAI